MILITIVEKKHASRICGTHRSKFKDPFIQIVHNLKPPMKQQNNTFPQKKYGEDSTLQGTNIVWEKENHRLKSAFYFGEMLVPWRVPLILKDTNCQQKWL